MNYGIIWQSRMCKFNAVLMSSWALTQDSFVLILHFCFVFGGLTSSPERNTKLPRKSRCKSFCLTASWSQSDACAFRKRHSDPRGTKIAASDENCSHFSNPKKKENFCQPPSWIPSCSLCRWPHIKFTGVGLSRPENKPQNSFTFHFTLTSNSFSINVSA